MKGTARSSKKRARVKGDALFCYKGHEFYDYGEDAVLHCFRDEYGESVEEKWDAEQYIAFLEEHNISCNPTNNGGLYA